jgi:hypothetical protein
MGARVKGTAAVVSLGCSGMGGATCRIVVTLSVTETVKNRATGSGHKARKKTVVLGTATVTLTAAKTATVKLALNGVGRKLLAAQHKLAVKLLITTSGKPVSTRTVTFEAAAHNP